jgi:hypothetical protein
MFWIFVLLVVRALIWGLPGVENRIGHSFLFPQEFKDNVSTIRNFSTRAKYLWTETLIKAEQQQIGRSLSVTNCYLYPSFCTATFNLDTVQGPSRSYALPANEQSLASNVIRVRGEYEEIIISVIVDILQLSDLHTENGYVLFDVGAGIGAWSIGLADRFTDKRTVIHSFDIFEEYLKTIEVSAHINAFQNTSFVFHSGVVTNIPDSPTGILTFSETHSYHNITTPIPAPVIYLDHLLTSEQIPCPTFIRFDIDYEELQAILGAEYLFYHCHPIVLVSVPCRNMTVNYVKFFERTGYRLGWMLSIPCADCQEYEWFETLHTHEPYLIAIPDDNSYLLFHPMIAGIDPAEYYDNAIHNEDRGHYKADDTHLMMTFANGYQEKSTYKDPYSYRCFAFLPPTILNYHFQTYERIEQVHDYLQKSLVTFTEGDPLEFKYREQSLPGTYKVMHCSSLADYQPKEDDITTFNMNDLNRIRFISAYYDIKRDSWTNPSYKRTNNKYFRYFQPLLMIDIDVVLFLDESLLSLLMESIEELQIKNRFRCKLRVILINEEFLFQSVHAFQHLVLERNISLSESFRNSSFYQGSACKECFNGDYTTMVHSKIDFVHIAMENLFPEGRDHQQNKDSEDADYVYAWVDFGLFKRFDEIPSRPINVSRIRENGKRIMINAVVPVQAYTLEQKVPFIHPEIIHRDSIITCVFLGEFKFILITNHD